MRQFVHHQLRHIRNYRQPAGHVAVQRAVAHRQLGLVPGAEQHRTKLVGERHQIISADARLDVFLGHVRSAIGERRRKRLAIGVKHIGDRNGDHAYAEVMRQRLCIPLAALARKRPRHGHTLHVFCAQSVHGNRRHNRGINAAAQPDQHFLESAFGNIIARADHQGAIRVFNFFRRLRMKFAFSSFRVEEDQIFLERHSLRSDFAIGGHRHARPVKNQAVVAAHLIHINHRAFVGHRDGAQHLQPQRPFVDGVWRRGDIQQQAGSLRD